MTPLNWQDAPSKNSVHHTSASSSATNPLVVSSSNPWFGISMGLLGLIVGFGIATVMKGGVGASPQVPSQQAQAPLAPIRAPTPAAAQQAAAPTPTAQTVPPVHPKTDHIRGDLAKATVAVIEYSDMECPFCKRVHPTYQQIMQTYGDKVVWVYRHFPLNFHANAQKEAEASDCAAELGGNDAFWKYTDKIFERTTSNGTGFPLDNLIPLAKEIGLNDTKFKSCLDTGKYAKHVQDEETAGQAAGVNGTPGNFVVNLKTQKQQVLSGAQPFSSFQSAIDAALKDAGVADAAAPSALAADANPSDGVRVIKMTAELWKWTPNIIKVKQGEKVTLEVTGISGAQG